MREIPPPVGGAGDSDQDEQRDVARVVVGPWMKAKAATTAGRLAERASEITQLLALKARQETFEAELLAAPANTLGEASERARYLIGLLQATTAARTPRRRKLIASVLEDLRRLSIGEAEREQ